MEDTPEQLFAAHRAWADELSARLARRLRIRRSDAQADGLLGLWDASKRYRADRGAAFRSYAAHRVRGAILDGRRELKPRSRRPRPAVGSLDGPVGGPDGPIAGRLVADGARPAAEALAAADEVRHLLRALSPREHAFVAGHFLLGKTQAELAREWGCHPSLVSLTLTRVLRLLRETA